MNSDQSFVVFGRFPTESDRRDGYFQRIAAIDRILSDVGHRRYLRTDGSVRQLSVRTTEKSTHCQEIRISRRWPWQVAQARKCIAKATSVFLHSILAAEQPIVQELLQSAQHIVLDLHGVVPEEAEMMGDFERIENLNRLEKQIVERADVLIGVSQKLIDHINRKWNVRADCKQIVLPIVPENLRPYETNIKKVPGKVVYAGGVQKWQQIEKMAELVQTQFEAKFFFFVPDVHKFSGVFEGCLCRLGVDNGGVLAGLTIDSLGPEELMKHYENAEYGLILREDHIVNRVASPTKLTEYLYYGVVPIVDSRSIGDFEEMGYRTRFWKDAFPSEEVRLEMVAENRVVVERLLERYEVGVRELKLALGG